MSNDGTINRQFSFEGLQVDLKHVFKTSVIYDEVKKFSDELWSQRSKTDSKENYLFDDGPEWSLGPLLKNNKFELGFTLLYLNKELYGCAGLRLLDRTTSISLARFLTRSSVFPYGNAFILPLHIEISKNQNLSSTIITFNDYNQHLARYYREILPKKQDPVSCLAAEVISKFEYLGHQLINSVQQETFRYNF